MNSRWLVDELKEREGGEKATLGAFGVRVTPVGGRCSKPMEMREEGTLAKRSGRVAGTRNWPAMNKKNNKKQYNKE